MLHIGSGALRPGDALTSVRALARRLHIHRNTVTSAYRDPVLTKLVVRRPGNQLVVRDPQSRQAEVGNGLGEFVDSTIRAARQRGYSLKELSGRLRDRLLAAPPDHVLVLSDDVGMQVLISAELSARFSMPIHTCSAADLLADPDRLLGALLVSPPGDIPTLEAVIPAERPAISMIYSSAVDHASRIRRLDHPSLIVVASISEYFLEMARGVLAPAVAIGHSIRSLLISGGPLAALGAADLIFCEVGYPFDSGDHNILWLAIGGPRKGLPIAPRFQACDGHGACVILDRPETQPRGPIACRPASGAPGCILGAVCWRPWIDQTTTPRGYLSQVDTPFSAITARTQLCAARDPRPRLFATISFHPPVSIRSRPRSTAALGFKKHRGKLPTTRPT